MLHRQIPIRNNCDMTRAQKTLARTTAAALALLACVPGTATTSLVDADKPPQFERQIKVFEVPENNDRRKTSPTYRIGIVEAVDPDSDTGITYTLAGKDADTFSIDSDGVITPRLATEFSRQKQAIYYFSVVATSDDKSSSVAVKVEVIEALGIKKQKLLAQMMEQTMGVSLADALDVTPLNLTSGNPDEIKWELDYRLWYKSNNNIWTPWEYEEKWAAEDITDTIKRRNLDSFVRNHGLGVDLAPDSKLRGGKVPLWTSLRRVDMKSSPRLGPERISYDGDIDTLLLSAYASFRENDYAGLALINSYQILDLTLRGLPKQGLDSFLSTKHAFVSTDLGGGFKLWLSAGQGTGDRRIENRPLQIVCGPNTLEYSDDREVDQSSYTGIISHRWNLRGLELSTRIKQVSRDNELEAQLFGVDPEKCEIPEKEELKTADTEIDLEVARTFVHAPGLLLQPFASVLERRRKVNEFTRKTTFAGGGLRLDWRWGMQLELSGHAKASGDSFDEDMIKRRMHFDLNNDDRGLILSMESGVESLELLDAVATSNFVNYEVAYAFPTWFASGGVSRLSINAVTGDLDRETSYNWRFTGRGKTILLSLAKYDAALEFSIND